MSHLTLANAVQTSWQSIELCRLLRASLATGLNGNGGDQLGVKHHKVRSVPIEKAWDCWDMGFWGHF